MSTKEKDMRETGKRGAVAEGGSDSASTVDGILSSESFGSVEEERTYFESAKVSEDVWSDWYAVCEYPRYRHPDTTIDCIIVTYDKDEKDDMSAVKALCIQRFTHPFIGEWCLPGTFMRNTDASAFVTIRRLLTERLGMDDVTSGIEIRPLSAFTGIDRDPRGQVISLAYMVYVRDGMHRIAQQPGVYWAPLHDFEEIDMCFDHNDIVDTAMSRLRDTFSYEPVVFSTLPERFLMSDAFRIRRSLFYSHDFTSANKKNFRKHYAELWEKVGNENPDDENSPGIFEMHTDDYVVRNRY